MGRLVSVRAKLKTEGAVGLAVEHDHGLAVNEVGWWSEAGPRVVYTQEDDTAFDRQHAADGEVGIDLKRASPEGARAHDARSAMNLEVPDVVQREAVIVGRPGPVGATVRRIA